MKTKTLIKTALILSAALVIASCGGGSDKPKKQEQPSFTKPSKKPTNQHIVAVQMAVFDKGSQVGFAPQKPLSIFVKDYYASTKTDFFITAYEDDLYHIGRKDIDLVQKYNIQALVKGSYTGSGFSLNDAGVQTSANAHAMAFVSDSKAYITRYGSTKAWVVNPSVQNASQFKKGELDLSAYVEKTDNKSKVPNMSKAIIANNKLFISLQRLGNKTSEWTAVRPGYVAVFDTNNNAETDTKKGKNGLKGIELKIRNPQSMALSGDYLYVSGLSYTGYDSGIEKINIKDYSSTVIYDDKETDPTPNNGLVVGKVSGVAVINGTDVYTRIYKGGTNDQLAKVKDKELEIVAAFKDKYVTTIKTGPDGDLWVGTGLKDTEQPKLYRLSKTDLSIKDSVTLPSNPRGITFIKKQ